MDDTRYYLAKPGTKDMQGPLTVAEINTALKNGSVTADYVYCVKGMKEWKPLVSLPGLEMAATAPSQPAPPAGAVPVGQQVTMVKPPNYLVSAILVTLLCCLPFGVVAIIKASQVDSLWYTGRYEEAHKASKDALFWYRLSFWSVAGVFLLYIIIILVSVALR